ncbi:MAG: hypothetical protein K6T81_09495 [Alicyclobacillus macrosporangiidus]|uniref:hypothetical protein n=1 Tax=Alicyclobacillus macrosporangiidus TaxID=392015 RepID=UPI0026E9F66C|nr:hypothetical protein [Alicyclobacillus macrosporangiidus]MCL6598964.1 hypothetical protein [Alicyclobacillus macrosporangiidus]
MAALKVRIFASDNSSEQLVQAHVNRWLRENAGRIEVVSMDTAVYGTNVDGMTYEGYFLTILYRDKPEDGQGMNDEIKEEI